MAAADMVFPPSLPPIPPPLCVDNNDNTKVVLSNVLSLAAIEGLVILAVVAMFILHVLGSLRRQSSNSFVHLVVMGVYTVSYPLVGYTIGRMQSTNWYFNDFTVWSVFLLLLLSSTDSLTACRLSDINNWKSIFVKQMFKGLLLVYILVIFGYQMHSSNEEYMWLWIPLAAILVIGIIKSYVMIASMRMVSKSYLGKNVNMIAEYMKRKDNQLKPFDPVTMEAYPYLVAGEKNCIKRPGSTPWYQKDDLKFMTVEKIWQCKGNLLTADRGKVLKDMCLSMALSKMLNRRFAGMKLSEAGLEKTHDFVFKGLLVDGDKPHQRAFRVMEQELLFVHDMYYTRYSYLYQKGRYLALCMPAIMIVLCWWLTVACLHVRHKDRNIMGSNQYRGMQYYTIFITVALAFLEAYQLYLYVASGWFKVGLIRSYVTTPNLQRSCCFEKIIDLLLRLKAFRPWKHTLGQYCLLDKLGRKSRFKSCLHYVTLRLVDKAMTKGRRKSKKLSENVKKAIVDSLLASSGHLTNGVTSLKNNGVHGHLSWACDGAATDGAATRTILIWHIATTLCKHHLEKEAKEPPQSLRVAYFKILKIAMARLKFSQGVVKTTPADNTTTQAVETASVLSNYCMHLLAFKPNLLPDHSSISESILDDAIEEAGNLLKKAKNNKMETRYEILMNISTYGCVGDEARLVEQGIKLAKHLIEEEPILRWRVLSDFWAEMMLYVSPSDDAQAHLELLARGGEFITHLWALLTHAGILNRGPSGQNNVV